MKRGEFVNVEKIVSLADWSREYQNPAWAAGVHKLAKTYSHRRVVRGDDNDFYRAVAYRFLEELVIHGKRYVAAFAARYKRRIPQS